MQPGNPVVGGTVLRRAAIQSPDFVAGSAGWAINADGTAQFNSVTFFGPAGLAVQITANGIQLTPTGVGAGGEGGFVDATGPGETQVSSGATNGTDNEAAIFLQSANDNAGKRQVTLIADTVTLNATTGANIPYPSAGITTVAQLVNALKLVAILS